MLNLGPFDVGGSIGRVCAGQPLCDTVTCVITMNIETILALMLLYMAVHIGMSAFVVHAFLHASSYMRRNNKSRKKRRNMYSFCDVFFSSLSHLSFSSEFTDICATCAMHTADGAEHRHFLKAHSSWHASAGWMAVHQHLPFRCKMKVQTREYS